MELVKKQSVIYLTPQMELELLNELKELFVSKINVTLTALYKIACELRLMVVNDGLTQFIRVVNGVDGLETHRSKVSKLFSQYNGLKGTFKETQKRILRMKSHIYRYYPDIATLLRDDRC